MRLCSLPQRTGGTPCLHALPQGLCWSWGHPRAPFQGVVVGRLMGEKVPATWPLQTLKGSLHLWGARIWGGSVWRSRFQRAGSHVCLDNHIISPCLSLLICRMLAMRGG